MIELPLKNGGVALVDDDFPDRHPMRGWYQRNGYVLRAYWKHNKPKVHLLHRVVLNAPDGLEVDHIDGNKLNNQSFNLRLCTHSENQRNRTRRNKNNKSGAKGVYFDSRDKTWYAQVTLNGKAKTVASRLRTINEAVIARNNHAQRMHGDFYCPSTLTP